MASRFVHAVGLLVALCLTARALPLAAQQPDDIVESLMYRSPHMPMPRVVFAFSERLIPLWLRALERPEKDLRTKAADAIALGHRRGMKGLSATVAPLLKAFDQVDQDPTVRLAVAKALITLDAKQAAPSFLRQIPTGGSDLRAIVEPALAKWDHRPARDLWLGRLTDPTVSPLDLALAIQALAVVNEPKALTPLRDIVLSDLTPPPLRLEAARALGAATTDGLEKDVAKWVEAATPGTLTQRLAAASMLRRHQSPAAIALLQRLATDPEPSVAALAVERLLEIDAKLLASQLPALAANPDSKLRLFAVQGLTRLPTEPHLRLLADRLDDVHIEVRNQARQALRQLATKKTLRESIITNATRILADAKWQGLEQATILLTHLDHKPASKRFLELLTADRAEVFVAAAWGLRKLQVAETLPAVTKFVESEHARIGANRPRNKEPEPNRVAEEMQLSHLIQLLGLERHRPAEAILRRLAPRQDKLNINEARAAAIWSLGLLHEGKNPADLSSAFEERLLDIASMPPEEGRVRWMAALSLGRMRSKDAVPSLKQFAALQEYLEDRVGSACVWAIAEITGEAPAPPRDAVKRHGDWFLVPVK